MQQSGGMATALQPYRAPFRVFSKDNRVPEVLLAQTRRCTIGCRVPRVPAAAVSAATATKSTADVLQRDDRSPHHQRRRSRHRQERTPGHRSPAGRFRALRKRQTTNHFELPGDDAGRLARAAAARHAETGRGQRAPAARHARPQRRRLSRHHHDPSLHARPHLQAAREVPPPRHALRRSRDDRVVEPGTESRPALHERRERRGEDARQTDRHHDAGAHVTPRPGYDQDAHP